MSIISSTNLIVPTTGLQLSPSSAQATTTWQRSGSSGATVTNSFCSSCGTTVFSQTAEPNMAALRFIKAGTLEDKDWLRQHKSMLEINRNEAS